MARTEELETKEQYAAVLSKYDTILFDCDGVIWEGDELIPGARQVLRWLRSQGKRCFFVTNNATKSRAANKAKFDKMGIECAVVSSLETRMGHPQVPFPLVVLLQSLGAVR